METRSITNPSAAIQQKIAAYFGESLCTINVQMIGRMADAIISYQDFKPVRVVRRELEQQFPTLNISEIHRIYSASARLSIMQELLDEDMEVFVPYEDGSLRPICLGELVEEKLYNRTISK